jgi:hypothetical protein
LINRIAEVGDLMMKKNDGGPPLAGTVLHVTWNLNEVFEGEELILGAYNEIMQMGAKLFLEGLALGETAKRCFPRAVFVGGGTSANWETTKEYDWYVSWAQLGIMITGHIVYIGEHRYTSLAGQKKPDDAWHFWRRDPSDEASPANAIVRDIARDCLMAQKVRSGAHFYDQHECPTSRGPCAIAATALGFPLETGDAYGIGGRASDRSPPRWSEVRKLWKTTEWTESNLPKAQNFAHTPCEIPWRLISGMKCEPGFVTMRMTPSRQDITPRWLLTMGLKRRLDSSIAIGESVIVAGEGQNREIRSALQYLWITHQEINYGFPGMVMLACELAMAVRSSAEASSPIKWPGMEAVTKQFDTSVSAVLDAEQDAGSTLVINGTLPDKAENDGRMLKWRFCAKEKTENHRDFRVTTFFRGLRKVVSTGQNAWRAWWEPKNSEWGTFAGTVMKDKFPWRIDTTEENIKNNRAGLHLHRRQKADEWNWAKAVEMQVYQDKQVRIPHSKAVPMRECVRKGYVTRHVPITHHMLPAITSTGCIFESAGDWTDNAMTTPSPHEGPCERPGIYTLASMSDSNKHGVATDILGDGVLYMVVVELQVLEGSKTDVQPTQKRCPGGVYDEEHCIVSAMCMRQVGLQAAQNTESIWCSVGQVAKTPPIIGDDLWGTRAIHTPTQINMREGKPPIGPHSKGLVSKNLHELMAKNFGELAHRPIAPPPLSDPDLPESVQISQR